MTRKGLLSSAALLGMGTALLGGAAAEAADAAAQTGASDPAVTRRHRIVVEVNVEGAEAWQGILTNVENLQKALGPEKTTIEVVAHGKGLGLLLSADTPTDLQGRLKEAATRGVLFAACENTMRRKNVRREDLFSFATTVPSGVTEVVLKQEAGYAYLKGGG